ncbi:MAG: anhydro-N-acetylmuramic acid kinase [Saprospiraceae bacterium]|jgi:anhydro-N-acetylmuramic acid kinase|nr:anhydro-N-acetylmuramic acid kinase [Saprospiraceae bacterium]
MHLETIKVVGVMSGSSLDGLDLALCEFTINKANEDQPIHGWQLLIHETIPLPSQWKILLKDLVNGNSLSLAQADFDFGYFIGNSVKDFLIKHNQSADILASHGHTIFHYPENKMTYQIGNGGAINTSSGLTTINDFRSTDIGLGGQGTPLAPTAEKILFEGYDFYLNIGGIANITAKIGQKFIAFDSTPANQVLNGLAQRLGFDYDEDGNIARSGDLNDELFRGLSLYPYFKLKYPKSLDNDWITKNFLQNILMHEGNTQDKLRTATEFIGYQIAQSINQIMSTEGLSQIGCKMMVSGGGAYNTFLLECIRKNMVSVATVEIQIPSPAIIEFKEAILVALLGTLRLYNLTNCLSSVTGASRDSIGGAIYQGLK